MTRPQFQYLDSSNSLWGQDSYLIWNLFSVCVFACLLGVSHLWRLQQDEPRQNISRWERETRTRKLSNSIQQQAERLGRIVLFVCDWQAEIVLLWQQTAISHFFIFFFSGLKSNHSRTFEKCNRRVTKPAHFIVLIFFTLAAHVPSQQPLYDCCCMMQNVPSSKNMLMQVFLQTLTRLTTVLKL